MCLTDTQKRDRIKELGEMIEDNNIANASNPDAHKMAQDIIAFILTDEVQECNESWCDGCEIRAALGGLCSEVLNFNS